MNFLWKQDMVKTSHEFENGCIPMHCEWRFNVRLSTAATRILHDAYH